MKKLLNFVLVFVAWMAVGNKSVARTTVLGSLSGKYVNALKVYGDTLFAACSDGLYMKDLRKNDAWKVIAFEGSHITSMVKRGDDILAICMNMKYREDPSARYSSIVMTNIRSGQTEVLTPSWITKREAKFKYLAQDNKNPDRVYVSCFLGENEEMGVYEFEFIASDEFGQGWNAVTTMEGHVNVCQQTSGDASYLFGYNDNLDCYCPLLYSSTDHFQTVTFVGEFDTNEEDREMIINNISICPTDWNRLLLSGHSGIALSRDGGVSWDFVTENTLAMAVFFDEVNGQDAYYVKTVTSDGKKTAQLYRSSDGGETWALWKEEEGVNPENIMMHQGALYFQNTLTGDVCQWPLKENVQDVSLVKEGKVWKWQSMNIMSGSRYEYEYFIQGDTLIDGEAYKKLYTLDAYMNKTTEPVYCGALREEGSKVYFVRFNHENVEFLYDFDLPVGGTMYYGHYNTTVVARDVITVNGIERKRVKVKEIQTDSDGEGADEGLTGYWVEGICSTSGLLEPAQFDTGLNISKLLAVYEDGKCIFTGEDFYPKKNSFVREGKRWEYEVTNLYYGSRYVYTMQGDTLFDEGSYKKLYLSVNDGKPTYQGAIRERNGKIYMVDKSKSWDEWDMPDFETVLCDFNAQVGDVVFSKEEYGDTYRLTVEGIDEVTVDGNARKRLTLRATTTHEDGSVEERGTMEWVEGIGSTEGFSGPMGLFYDGGLYSHLIACYEYDEPVFMQEDFYGRIINGRNYELDESREHENVKYINLSLENGVVLKAQGDRMVVADRENGAAICLFGTGLEAEEGTELSGTIAGALCECNDLSTLFPTRSTDLSTVQKGGMAEDLSFDSFTVSNLRTDYNYWYKAMNIQGARIITTDQGIFVAGNDGQPYLHLNDVFGVLDGISLPMTAQTLFGCFSPRMYRNVTQDSFVPLSVTTGESTGIEDISSHTSPLTSHPSILYDLQGRRVDGNRSLPRGIYIIYGKKVVVK